LLHDGGFTTAGTQHDGPAFICRLGNAAFHGGTQYPTPDQEGCVLTPPASAYWSYWLAPRGQNSWTYSQLGAMSEVPKPGEVELWQFGATNVAGTEGRPTVAPETLRAHNPGSGGGSSRAPKPSTSRADAPTRTHARQPTGPAAPRPGGGADRRIGHDRTALRSRAATGSASTTGTTARHDPGRSSSPSSSAPARVPSTGVPRSTHDASGSGPAIVDASPASKRADAAGSSGSPTALIVGVLVALLLAAGAGWTVWRRHHDGTPN
jgi:hypothetical protein